MRRLTIVRSASRGNVPRGGFTPRGFSVVRRAPLRLAPEPRMPRRFKVVDVMTREVLAEDVDTRTTVKLLDGVRSIVDVTIFVWQPEDERWRMLTLDETRSLWRYRGAVHDTAAQPG